MKKEELDKWHHILLVDVRALAGKIEKSKCWRAEKTVLLVECKAIETRIEDIIEILDKGEEEK